MHLIAQRFGLFGKAFMNLFDLLPLGVSKVQSGQRAQAAWSSRAMGAVSKRAAQRSRRTAWVLRRVLRKNDSGCR